MISLDQKVTAIEEERDTLKAENQQLRAQVKPLERENERLKQRVEEETAKAARAAKLSAFKSDKTEQPAAVHELESAEIEMIKFIGERNAANAEEIGAGLSMHSVEVEHYLGRLVKAEYLGQDRVPVAGYMLYMLSDKANAYLVKNKLVPLRPAEKASNPKGHHCDHCGSVRLRRTGSKPDPTFHGVGIKMALYSCLDCGKESGFTNDESVV
jgi:DNA-directed RNA polymerase subunit RPC12/RpoP